MKPSQKKWLSQNSAHDYEALTLRWKSLAQKLGLRLHVLSRQSGYDIFVLRSEGRESGGGVYLSAGVHGDEAAPVWALLEWAEANQEWLMQASFTILPCVNPWGFVNNVRLDEQGRDLNRMFENTRLPFFCAWKKMLADQQFSLAVNLHEDYDAQGIYAYELAPRSVQVTEQIFAQTESIIARESRDEVDGQQPEAGIVRHTGDIRKVVEEDLQGGYPEAIYLYLNHSQLVLTFETPSEFAFHKRVRAHRAFIEAAIRVAKVS